MVLRNRFSTAMMTKPFLMLWKRGVSTSMEIMVELLLEQLSTTTTTRRDSSLDAILLQTVQSRLVKNFDLF
jgi:hypothetical protein